MTRDFWATFVAALPEEDNENPHPKGWPVTVRLMEALRSQGVTVQEPDNWRDSGYSVDCTIDGRKVYFFVSHIGRGQAQWVVCCTADSGFIARLMKRSVDVEKEALARAIDRALKAGEEFSSVRWYPNGWHGRGNESWVDAPRRVT